MTVLVTIVAGLLLPIGIALTIVVGTVVGLMTAVGSTAATAAALVPAERDSVCFGDGIRSLGARTSAAIVPERRRFRRTRPSIGGSEDHRTERDGDHQQSPCAPVGKRAGGNPARRPKTRVLVSSISTIPPSGVVPSVNSATPANSGDIAVSRRGRVRGGHEQRGRIQHTSVRRPVPFRSPTIASRTPFVAFPKVLIERRRGRCRAPRRRQDPDDDPRRLARSQQAPQAPAGSVSERRRRAGERELMLVSPSRTA